MEKNATHYCLLRTIGQNYYFIEKAVGDNRFFAAVCNHGRNLDSPLYYTTIVGKRLGMFKKKVLFYFHLLRKLKIFLARQKFGSNEKVIQGVNEYLEALEKTDFL